MWIFIWLILSVFTLGVFFWSTAILQQQKRAWSVFALKTGLQYEGGKFNASPIIRGVVNGHRVLFFTDIRQTSDPRGRRYMTAIEIEMGPGMPTGAAIASPEFETLLASVRMSQTYAMPIADWNKKNIVKTRDAGVLAAYLTPERLKIIQGLFAMKNAQILFFFDEQDAVLRIETVDPLRDAARMEKMSRSLYAAADILALKGRIIPASAPDDAALSATPAETPPAPPVDSQPETPPADPAQDSGDKPQ